MIRNFNDETNFPYNLLLTDTQVLKIRKAFANSPSTNKKISKIHLSKSQSGGFNILDLMNPAEVVYKIANKANNLSNKVSLGDIIKMADVSRKFLPDPKKVLPGPTICGRRITLTNTEIKDIMKVVLRKKKNFVKGNC